MTSPLICLRKDVKGQVNPTQASGDRISQVSRHWETRRIRLNSPVTQARRIQPRLRETGCRERNKSEVVDLIPNLVTRVEENLKKTNRKVKLTIFPVNTATWCIFARDCVWASFQMSRSVETCIRGCQDYPSSNTQDILSILTGRLPENKQEGKPRYFAR